MNKKHLHITTFFCLFTSYLFAQNCKSFKIVTPTQFCTSENKAFVLKMTLNSKVYTWNLQSDSLSFIDTTPCGLSLKLITDTEFFDGTDKITLNPGFGGPEDISVSGDLTQTSRSELFGSLSTRSVCGDFGNSQVGWRIYTALPSLSVKRRNIVNDSVYFVNPVRVLEPLRMGIGANLRDLDKLGASAKYLLSDNSILEFAFLLEPNGDCLRKCVSTDTKPPVITKCPANVEKTSSSTTACVAVTWQTPTVTDETSTPSVSSNFQSGFCFPVGTTKVIYTAKDAAGNTSTCSFNVIVKPKPVVTCAQYIVDNTNQRCNPQTWKPYALIIGTDLYKADKVVLKQYSDGTATLLGIFRSSRWNPVKVNINLTDYDNNAPNAKLTFGYCLPFLSPNNRDWTVYKNWSGTIQFNNDAPIAIKGSKFFQIGKGANLQNLTDLGAASTFYMNGKTGLFSFKLINSTSCETAQSLSSLAFEANGEIEADRIKLDWFENKSSSDDIFAVERLGKEDFERIGTMKAKTESGLRQYTFYDDNPLEGENVYRITLIRKSGSQESESFALGYKKQAYAYVFPNPADNDLNIKMKTIPTGKITAHLYNALGFEVKTVQTEKNANLNINVNGLPNGLYMLRVSQPNKRDYMQQVIISH